MTPAKKVAIEAAEKLAKLLASPEPGLATWHMLCEGTYQRLASAIISDAETVKLSTELAERRLR